MSKNLFESLQERSDGQTVGDGGVLLVVCFGVEQRKLEKSFETIFREILAETDAAGTVVAQRHAGVDGSLVEEDDDLPDEFCRHLIGNRFQLIDFVF